MIFIWAQITSVFEIETLPRSVKSQTLDALKMADRLRPDHFETQAPVRSLKLSYIETGQDFEEELLGYIWCFKLGCAAGVINNSSELKTRDPSSNSSRMLYFH